MVEGIGDDRNVWFTRQMGTDIYISQKKQKNNAQRAHAYIKRLCRVRNSARIIVRTATKVSILQPTASAVRIVQSVRLAKTKKIGKARFNVR